MPERNVGKPRPKFRCQWRIGDTFAYQLTGQEAKELGIHGKYMLLRKVSEVEFGDGSLYPIVTVSFLGDRTFPTSDEAFMDIPLLKLQESVLFRRKMPPNAVNVPIAIDHAEETIRSGLPVDNSRFDCRK